MYVVEGGIKYPRQRSWTRERFNVCAACHGLGPTPMSEWHTSRVRWYKVTGRGEVMERTPCVTCGLLVIRNADPLLQRVTCSHACTTSLTRIRNGNRGSGQPCETCGERITTGRADSRYCGSACRQKAYRQRSSATGAPRPEAPPLTDARGRRMPQRSQRKSLQSGITHLSGLAEAMAHVDELDAAIPKEQAIQWTGDLEESITVIDELHQKLQERAATDPNA